MVYWQIYVARSHHCEVHRWLTSWILTNKMLGLNSLYALIGYYLLQWSDNWKLYLWSGLWMITWFSLMSWIHPSNIPCDQQKRSQQHHVLGRQHMSTPSAGQLYWWDGFFQEMSHNTDIMINLEKQDWNSTINYIRQQRLQKNGGNKMTKMMLTHP